MKEENFNIDEKQISKAEKEYETEILKTQIDRSESSVNVETVVMLRETIWRHRKNNYGIMPNWLIMTGSFYDKLLCDLGNSNPIYTHDLMQLHKFEGVKIAVIPTTYGAEPKVESAT